MLSPMALSLLCEWEYERMEVLAEEAEWEADEVFQLDGCVMSHCVLGKPARQSQMPARAPVAGFTTKG